MLERIGSMSIVGIKWIQYVEENILFHISQPCKIRNLAILAENLLKPADSLENLEILASYFFESDGLKEHVE